MKRIACWLLAGLMFGALAAPAGLSAAEPLKVGDMAPDFELQASDGNTYKLSDFNGKKVVVVAWFPRAFTGGCTKECISFRESGEKMKQFQVAYFTASTDAVKKNTEFAESLKLDYPILSDPNGVTASAYGIYNAGRNAAARTTFIIGKDGTILDIDSKVNTAQHASDVAAKLTELGVDKN
ncbi:peroxiredoxin [Lignipirellula cremea]|uniref:Peroxiredoxin bcp n=1 Tax=Lignipirellula cremea TaxID=2528010 RepID=A0A518E165_9BACT|nr:peroxiredoxin [Lignipirellula cremea]QDU97847.1 Putative peroxiredoxin bcp [Lignipirellula cremea]